jgi:hypothetical protein
MEKRHNTTPDLATWPTRKSMVRHGLAMNLPWLAFVNVSFALMLLLRNVLFGDVDTLIGTTKHLALMVIPQCWGSSLFRWPCCSWPGSISPGSASSCLFAAYCGHSADIC